MPLTLEQINAATPAEAAALLDGLYEHSPWIAEAALSQRPFRSLAHLKQVMAQIVRDAGREPQLALIRAHPELAGKAMVSNTLTAESTHEQSKAGLTNCTPEEFARIQTLNADYNAKFGFPFILAVRGPRGTGLSKRDIIDTFARRLDNHPDFEVAECLRNIHRIVEIRLNDKFGVEPVLGNLVWDWQEALAQHSDPGYAEKGQLTVTYLTDAHRACAQRISRNMRDAGFDEVHVDAVGNVVARYRADRPNARTLLTGSHYDTVRNGGKYDGRLGIFVPIECVQRELARQVGCRLPFGIEVIGFAEEEGQRYKATFLGSGALTGRFPSRHGWTRSMPTALTMREAMQKAGLPCHAGGHRLCCAAIPRTTSALSKSTSSRAPCSTSSNLPLGIVTSINGGVRYAVRSHWHGQSCRHHADGPAPRCRRLPSLN
jgi:N-carbamoyl-L-amino-acid hydrolase